MIKQDEVTPIFSYQDDFDSILFSVRSRFCMIVYPTSCNCITYIIYYSCSSHSVWQFLFSHASYKNHTTIYIYAVDDRWCSLAHVYRLFILRRQVQKCICVPYKRLTNRYDEHITKRYTNIVGKPTYKSRPFIHKISDRRANRIIYAINERAIKLN